MPSLLLVQNRRNRSIVEDEHSACARAVSGYAHLTRVSALDETLPWSEPQRLLAKYDGLIIGGSSEFDFDGGRGEANEGRIMTRRIFERLTPLMSHVLAHDVPALGICLGHQLFAEHLGVRVQRCEVEGKVGTFAVQLTAAGVQDPLFSGLPRTFNVQYAHKDTLTDLPASATILATGTNGAACARGVLRYTPHVYSMQFHPELTVADMYRRMQRAHEYIPANAPSAAELFSESPEADTLLPRFVEQVVQMPAMKAHSAGPVTIG